MQTVPPPAALPFDGAEPVPPSLHPIAALHRSIDVHTRSFAEASSIACPSTCGRCCLSPNVETTIADVLPLCEELVRRGAAEELLQLLQKRTGQGACVLYEPLSADGDEGRCSMYAWRPSICRLFGFAGRRDADGQPTFNGCRVHKQIMPETVEAVTAAVRLGTIALPIFSDLANQVATIEPVLGTTLLPINEALRVALERALLQARLNSMAANTSQDDGDDEGAHPPRTPRVPPRRRAA